ncbi:callose synthase 3-like [Papaver somniferum]|uniref:callose synthase 3-like n=1 Tax=Papaver somniferum TaxID=3469 RepID=UPI000E6F8381|nr:callose synthase 3-like [Papaver somniferum]
MVKFWENPIGLGVSSFKTALPQRLQREDLPSLLERVKRSDEQEVKSIYKHYSRNYLEALEKYKDKPNHWKQLSEAHKVALSLHEVEAGLKLADLKSHAKGSL